MKEKSQRECLLAEQEVVGSTLPFFSKKKGNRRQKHISGYASYPNVSKKRNYNY
ncbi:MAG: hypothetical protein HYX24_01045 [Candidatus Aenigmarchaeota archaeon]|nr:hypothetical protein [Candidatus Aenigmarchaeota archaeon]